MNAAPALTDEHRRLHRLAGHWSGVETLAATPWMAGGTAQAIVETRIGLGGFFVLQDYRQLRDGIETLAAHAVLGWNAEASQVTMFWFDSIGYVPETPATGAWQGDTLVLLRSSRRGAARHTQAFHGDGECHTLLEFQAHGSGAWITVSDALLRRS